MAETQRQMLDSGFPTRKDVLQELMDGKIAGYDKKSRLQVTVNGKEEEIGVFTAEPIADFISVIFTIVLFSFRFKASLRKLESK